MSIADGPDQPPELDPEPEPGCLPPPERAAERVRAFLSRFGDGLVDAVDDAPLFARDLEALARLIERHDKAREHALHQAGVTSFATGKAWRRQFDILRESVTSDA